MAYPFLLYYQTKTEIMKKKWMVVATAVALGITQVNAQSDVVNKKTGMHLGARVGANLSNVVKDNSSSFSTDPKLGFNAAVFLEIPLAPILSIQPEVQFSQKGYKASGSFLGSSYEYKQTTNFIEVPLLLKIKPSKSFGIIAGPQFSYLLSTKTKFTNSNATYEDLVKQDNDNLRKNILGGVIGVEATAGNLVVDLRYNRDFQNNNGDGTSSTPRYKNQVVALSLGLRF